MPVSITHALLPRWFSIELTEDQSKAADIGTLKQALTERGVNSRGWRLYLDFGDALFAPLEPEWVGENRPFSSCVSATAYLRILQGCEMDVLPPPALVSSISRWNIPERGLRLVPSGLLRAAWKACIAAEYAGGNLVRFITDHIAPVACWFFATGQHEVVDANRLKAGWPTLERGYLASQPASVKATVPSIDSRQTHLPNTWPVPVISVDFEGTRFDYLGTPAALAEEGQAMQHCIGTYVEQCQNSSLRAYSVRHRKTGARVATLTVFFNLPKNYWQLSAIKGPANAEVEPRLLHASTGLLRSLDEATAEDFDFRQLLTRINSTQFARTLFDEDDCCHHF